MKYSALNKRRLMCGILVVVGYLFVLTPPVQAAVYLVGGEAERNSNSIRIGEEVTVKIGIDTEGERINVVQVVFLIPEGFEVVAIDRATSAVNLWVEEPQFDSTLRAVKFIGGIPGGLTGRVALLTVRLKAVSAGSYALRFTPSSEAYLNDGQGTRVTARTQELQLMIEGGERAWWRLRWAVVGILIVVFILWYIVRYLRR